MPDNQEIGQLLFKHLQGNLTAEETHQLEHWANQSPSNRSLLENLDDEEKLIAKLSAHMPENREALRNRMLQQIHSVIGDPKDTDAGSSAEEPALVRPLYRRWWVAASVLAILSAGTYWLVQESSNRQSDKKGIIAETIAADIPPGRNGAVLTLHNGKTISLDSAANGSLLTDSSFRIKIQDGQLLYAKQRSPLNTEDWNTVTTARGRQFVVQLADGTKVWLNAGSSLKYPVAFLGNQRKVELSGEAYFEVTPDSKKPFLVSISAETNIEVLGTSFNVNAYSNEPSILATLISGSIRAKKNGKSTMLLPGQQAVINEKILVKEAVNTGQVIAWKNGFFNLNGVSFEAFMRQLSRWYDIDVSWEGPIPQKQFWGEIYRGEHLSKVLEFLQHSGIKNRIENNGKSLVLTQ